MDFNMLSTEEKLQAVCAWLVTKRFFPSVKLGGTRKEPRKEKSSEMAFIEENSAEISRRLESCGFQFHLAPGFEYAEAKAVQEVAPDAEKLTVTECKFLVGLALLYEQSRNNLGRFSTCDATMSELLTLLTITYPAFAKTPQNDVVDRTMKRFEHAGLVVKLGGLWHEEGTKFFITPCMKAIASREFVDAYTKAFAAELDTVEGEERSE